MASPPLCRMTQPRSYFNPIRIIRDCRLGRKPRSDKRWSLLDSQGAGCSLVWSNRKFRHRSVRLPVTEENHFQVRDKISFSSDELPCSKYAHTYLKMNRFAWKSNSVPRHWKVSGAARAAAAAVRVLLLWCKPRCSSAAAANRCLGTAILTQR